MAAIQKPTEGNPQIIAVISSLKNQGRWFWKVLEKSVQPKICNGITNWLGMNSVISLIEDALAESFLTYWLLPVFSPTCVQTDNHKKLNSVYSNNLYFFRLILNKPNSRIFSSVIPESFDQKAIPSEKTKLSSNQ